MTEMLKMDVETYRRRLAATGSFHAKVAATFAREAALAKSGSKHAQRMTENMRQAQKATAICAANVAKMGKLRAYCA